MTNPTLEHQASIVSSRTLDGTESQNTAQVTERKLLEDLRLHPDSAQNWFSLGNLYHTEDKLLEAIEAYWQALSLQPNSFPIFNNLGYAFQQLEHWDEAVLCYQKALQIQPQASETSINLGNVLHSLGQLSTHQIEMLAQANYQLGLDKDRLGELKTAEYYLRKAVSLAPTLADIHAHLGIVLSKQTRFEDAIVCCQNALKYDRHHRLAKTCLYQIEKQKQQIGPAASKKSTLPAKHSSPSASTSDIEIISDVTILKKVSGALINWAKTGFSVVDDITYEKRYRACMRCPNMAAAPPKFLYRVIRTEKANDKICQLCGCILSRKARIASESCPDVHPEHSMLTRWEEPLEP
ncbi:MAG: tetratricopeptide repeat protein [Leptolyngbyaceae cyanobacterium]